MNTNTYEKCPVCGKKGWYISACQYDRDRDLHQCRYCFASEYIDFDDKYRKKVKRPTNTAPDALPLAIALSDNQPGKAPVS